MSEIGERLRRLRVEARLSQVELAGQELSPSYVSLIESGRRQPSPDAIALLARRLGCAPSRLADGRPSSRHRELEMELARAEAAVLAGEPERAVARLTSMLEHTDEDVHGGALDTARLLLARAFEARGDRADAVRLLGVLAGRTRSGGVSQPPVLIADRLAAAYLSAGDVAMARTAAERGIAAAGPDLLDPSPELARLLYVTLLAAPDAHTTDGHTDDRHATARRLLDVTARLAAAGAGACYLAAGDHAVRQDRPEEALTLFRLASTALATPTAALEEVDRLRLDALEVLIDTPGNPDNPGAAAADLLELAGTRSARAELVGARALLALGRAGEAATVAARILDAAPTDPLAHRTLGDAQSALGRQPEATASYRRAADLLAQAPAGRTVAALTASVAERLHAAGDSVAAARAFRLALDQADVRATGNVTAGAPLRRQHETIAAQP